MKAKRLIYTFKILVSLSMYIENVEETNSDAGE